MPAEQPNILFLFSDEHSFRCLGHHDGDTGEPIQTPTLDELAATGTRFDQAYCQMPLCTPSRLTMLTGRRVPAAGAWNNGSVLPPRADTMADVFGRNGYDTALVGKMHLGGSRQFVGFDERPYGDLTGATGHQWEPTERAGGRAIGDRIADAGVTEIPESQLQEAVSVRESLAWIRDRESRSDTPWFLMTSFSRPHFPLTAPRRHLDRYWDLAHDRPRDRLTRPAIGPTGDTASHPMTRGAIEGFQTADIDEEAELRARAGYFAAVDYLDELLGDLFAGLAASGALENTIVVYASDHGELAGEHGLWWKHTWHEAATRVPLIVQTPGHRRGSTDPTAIDTPVGLIDLFPTLCDVGDIPQPDGLEGCSLADAVRDGREPNRGPVVCDNFTDRWGPGTEFRMVREGQFKYVEFRDAPEILIDLAADPDEQTNLAQSPDSLGSEQRDALHRLREYVDNSVDFEQNDAQQARDLSLQDRYAIDAETRSASGNCYMRPDGAVIDADTPLYAPHVVTDDAAETFSDYRPPER